MLSLPLRCLDLLLVHIADHLLLPLRSLVQEVVVHVHVLPEKAGVVIPERLAVGLQPGVSVGAVVVGLKRLATGPASFDQRPELLHLLRVGRGHVVGLVGVVFDVEEIGGRARLAVLIGSQLSSQIDPRERELGRARVGEDRPLPGVPPARDGPVDQLPRAFDRGLNVVDRATSVARPQDDLTPWRLVHRTRQVRDHAVGGCVRAPVEAGDLGERGVPVGEVDVAVQLLAAIQPRQCAARQEGGRAHAAFEHGPLEASQGPVVTLHVVGKGDLAAVVGQVDNQRVPPHALFVQGLVEPAEEGVGVRHKPGRLLEDVLVHLAAGKVLVRGHKGSEHLRPRARLVHGLQRDVQKHGLLGLLSVEHLFDLDCKPVPGERAVSTVGGLSVLLQVHPAAVPVL